MGLFTIGHSRHTVDHFIEMLSAYGITYLLDIRSIPYSKFAPQFNREELRKTLQLYHIQYAFMGAYLGARQENRSLYNKNGYLDFDKVRNSRKFNCGLENVLIGLEQGHQIALMCSERDPINCHRAILVARAFVLRGVPVEHILDTEQSISHQELDQRLLNLYFPECEQLSILTPGSVFVSDADRLQQAYALRNKEIGYRASKT